MHDVLARSRKQPSSVRSKKGLPLVRRVPPCHGCDLVTLNTVARDFTAHSVEHRSVLFT